ELLALHVMGDDRRDREAVVTQLAVALHRVESGDAVGDLAVHEGLEVVGAHRVAADLHPELFVEVAGVVVGAAAAGEGEGGARRQGGGEDLSGVREDAPVCLDVVLMWNRGGRDPRGMAFRSWPSGHGLRGMPSGHRLRVTPSGQGPRVTPWG